MEVNAKILREVEFRDRLRGYDTDEVDEFLEKVAVGLDEIQAELLESRARVAAVERQLEEMPVNDDDSIRRTLVLAQRTADLAVKEATAEAERLLDDARAEADRVLLDARAAVQQLRSDAEIELSQRVTRLSDRREVLERDVEALTDLVDAERERITEALGTLLAYVSERMHVGENAHVEPTTELAPFLSEPPLPSATVTDMNLELDLELPDVERQVAEDAGIAFSGGQISNAPERASDPDEELWERWAQSGEPAPDLGPDDPFHLGGRGSDERGA